MIPEQEAPRRPAIGVIAMLIRPAIAGSLGALLPAIGVNALSVPALTSLGGCLVLIPIVILRGHSLDVAFRAAHWWRLLKMSVIEVGAIAVLVQGLKWAPAGPVLALAMAAPAIIMVRDTLARRRPLTLQSACATALIIVALVLLGAVRGQHSGATHGNTHFRSGLYMWLGLGCAVLAAVLTACYINLLNQATGSRNRKVPAVASSAVFFAGTGLVASPMLIWLPPRPLQALAILGIGAGLSLGSFFFVLGFKNLSNVAASSLDLAQPFWGGLLALRIFHQALPSAQILAIVCIATSVWLNLRAKPPATNPRDALP